jgi:hypothetical protein
VIESHSSTKKKENVMNSTRLVLGILVGASIQQQTRADRVTIGSGKNQRRPSVLHACICANAPPPPHKSITNAEIERASAKCHMQRKRER